MSDCCALRVKGLRLASRAHMLQVERGQRNKPVLMPPTPAAAAMLLMLIATVFELAVVPWRQVLALVVPLLDNAQVIVMFSNAIRLSLILILH